MRKIPTLYVRDFEGTLGPPGRFLTREPHPDCDWVFDGEGVATQKLDGTCCRIMAGRLYRRHEVKVDKRTGQLRETPAVFTELEVDPETGNKVGWVLADESSPADVWHFGAFKQLVLDELPLDGTYELIGPHVNKNPEQVSTDRLVSHADPALELRDVPTGYDQIREYLEGAAIEGVVWHHADGRMAKIKGRDFGIVRP